MAEDQDTQTGAAVYPAFMQYAGDPQKISMRPDRSRNKSPKISRQVEIKKQALKL
jgi:hypothetical protein